MSESLERVLVSCLCISSPRRTAFIWLAEVVLSVDESTFGGVAFGARLSFN